MKKVILLGVMAIVISSCVKLQPKPEEDPTYDGYLQTTGVVNQSIVALDAFNVAFRLNVLMNEGNGDITAAPESAKNTLLGSLTTIEKTDAGLYTIKCNGVMGSKDYMRSGTIYIETGNKSLSTPGNQWVIYTKEEFPYIMTSGRTKMQIDLGSYTVSNTQVNAWEIVIGGFVSKMGNDMDALWNSTVKIEQEMSKGQTLADIGQSIYSMFITVTNSETMYYGNKFDASTVKPLKINPVCMKNSASTVIVGDGQMRVWEPSEMMLTLSDCVWLGTTIDDCEPKMQVTYNKSTKIYD